MNSFILPAILIAMLAVLIVMVLGIVSMVKGGEFNKKYGNKIMQARVILQGAALGLIALAFFISQK
jgi:hypothetical protein